MNAISHLDEDALIRHRPELIAAESGGEMIVLDPDRGEFVELSKTGACIWALLDNPMSIAMLCKAMADQFAIDADTCHRDVADFVAALDARGMIERVAAPRA